MAAASTARTGLCDFTGGPGEVVPVVGATVGNRPAGSVPDVPLPDSGGRLTGGSVAPAVGLDVEAGRATTTSVAEPLKELAAVPDAVAVSWTCSPMVALLPTRTPASSSSAWSSGMLPIVHLAPAGSGHTLKLGDRISVAEATRAVTVTPLADAFVVQTQIAKLATCPGLTCDELENGWIRTHSCGFLAGAGDLLVGVGVGVGDAEVGLGDGVAVGLELVLFGVGVVVVVVVALEEGVWLGDELLALGAELEVGVELALVLLVLVGVELALALLLADFVLGESLGGLPGHFVTCVGAPDAGATTASRAAFFGTDEHAELTMGGLAASLTSAASAWPSTEVERNANPQTAPTTVGLTTTCALTVETSLQRSTPPDHPDAS